MNTATAPVVTLNAEAQTSAPRVHPGFPRLSTRPQANSGGPNHHLFNNNGTWFIHYTLFPDPFTKQRVRASLKTANLHEARQRRDAFFAQLPGGDVILRMFSGASAAA
jgi:hypothetical protein